FQYELMNIRREKIDLSEDLFFGPHDPRKIVLHHSRLLKEVCDLAREDRSRLLHGIDLIGDRSQVPKQGKVPGLITCKDRIVQTQAPSSDWRDLLLDTPSLRRSLPPYWREIRDEYPAGSRYQECRNHRNYKGVTCILEVRRESQPGDPGLFRIRTPDLS